MNHPRFLLVSNDEILSLLPEFLHIYGGRPIKQNRGGMGFNHCFATWVIAKKLRPTTIVESGVWQGQSTWLLEQACPDSTLYCIDPRPDLRIYTSDKAKYMIDDFSTLDWSGLDVNNTLCFFDDHQNAYARLIELKWWGFKHAIFEDNVPCGEGDCYSFRHVQQGFGHPRIQMSKGFLGNWKIRLQRKRIERILMMFYPRQAVLRKPNTVDRVAFERNVEIYQEMPAVIRYPINDFGGSWQGFYTSVDPLYESFNNSDWPEVLKKIEEEDPGHAFGYAYICYVKLR